MLKKQIPLAITFITGVIIVVTFFIPHSPFGRLQQDALTWYSVIFGFTMLLGVDSLVKFHYTKLRRREKGWWFSIIFYCGFLLSFITGVISEVRFGDAFNINSSFMYFYVTILVPLQSTMFALLAFFIASASYRAFRARNIDATFLLVTAVIVMLGRVPVGYMLWHKLPNLTSWILNVLQLGPMRGIMIGISLGTVAMSLRLILGIERTYLS